MVTTRRLDETFRVLANSRRRQLLVALLDDTSRSTDGIRISDAVHAGEVSGERLWTELVHKHLPRLEDAGFARWDEETDTVGKGPRFEEIRPFLELLQTHADEGPSDRR